MMCIDLVFQDIMVIDQSVLYGVPEEDDRDEDMHLHVDNMSYEVTLQKPYQDAACLTLFKCFLSCS